MFCRSVGSATQRFTADSMKLCPDKLANIPIFVKNPDTLRMPLFEVLILITSAKRIMNSCIVIGSANNLPPNIHSTLFL